MRWPSGSLENSRKREPPLAGGGEGQRRAMTIFNSATGECKGQPAAENDGDAMTGMDVSANVLEYFPFSPRRRKRLFRGLMQFVTGNDAAAREFAVYVAKRHKRTWKYPPSQSAAARLRASSLRRVRPVAALAEAAR